jgi:exodeoxyribonuclease VII small subunit
MVARGTEKAARAAEAPAASYDAVVARLEHVVAALEAGDLPLEASVEKFAEGIQLARDAARRLDEAEARVELLVKGADGQDEVAPFEPERGSPP